MVQLPKMIENLKEDTFELQFSGEAEVDGEVGECFLAPEGLLALSEGRGPRAPELSVPPKVKRVTESQSTGGQGGPGREGRGRGCEGPSGSVGPSLGPCHQAGCAGPCVCRQTAVALF